MNDSPNQSAPAPPKLLVITYACAPGKGSEWGAGWAFVRDMSRTQDVWVITHDDNRADIEAELPNLPDDQRARVHVSYVKLSRPLGWMRNSVYSLLNLHYYFWQHAAAREAKRLHATVGFDVVQHVSYMRWWMPSAGAALAPLGVKFVFGPVVGGDLMPARFRRHVRLKYRIGEFQRWLARELWSLDPALGRCIRAADLVVCGTRSTLDSVSRFNPKRTELISSGTMSAPEIIEHARRLQQQRPKHDRFRVVSVGGMSYYRGIDLCLRAFARANLPDAEYVHCCNGPDRPRIEALARELGIADRVTFTGDRKHIDNVATLGTADVYMHAVLRDSMGTIPEAMALGLPVLTLDLNTSGLMVDETSGYRVKLTPETGPEDVVDQFTAVLRRWHADPELRHKLGQGARRRSELFTQAARGQQHRQFHRAVLGLEPASTTPPVEPVAA